MELVPTTLFAYFVIGRQSQELLTRRFSEDYDEAKAAASVLGGVVTNASRLRWLGYKVEMFENADRGRKAIQKVTVNGKKLIKGYKNEIIRNDNRTRETME
jgi:hypothetical protein